MKTRRAGTALIVGGLLVLAYAAAVLFWRDPVTDVYNRYQQNRLESALEAEFEAWDASPAAPAQTAQEAPEGEETEESRLAAARAATARDARRFVSELDLGQAFGRLTIPRIDLETVVVHGTRWGPDLSRGPGHYEQTTVPGLGRTVGVAGHRTTFGAPLREIDSIEVGDEITLEMPYGTFRYEVFEHEIVDSDDWSVIRGRGFDTIMLSACHPLYSAAQRWIVYGRLVEVRPHDGEAYTLASAR
ncbi:MAG TPA: class E sortase [Gaiellaceae bacterium]|nr:class E sortase [Gaiellaceae bacterium]